ncbi:MAG TPA: hypothetical protein PK668_05785 [Myxococcota bacterium]|nr:hypothetical protein [Myxococcota bacterium]HRY92649.1 hypothetical protein [Myxococcota bacterium]HSA24470.1 hypothetical protein [Myxococcota bacterium]
MKTAMKLVALVALVGLVGCGGSERPELFEQQAEVSDCGGFGAAGGALRDVPAGYCDAELLRWEYDAGSQVLSLTDQRVSLNCCGLHDATLALVDGVYVLTETDDPEFGDARCACMCTFDFAVTATGIPAGEIQLRLELLVSDWAEGSGTVWEGSLDLSQGSGQVVVDDQPAAMCGL